MRLTDSLGKDLSEAEFLQLAALLFWSHLTGISIDKIISIIRQLGLMTKTKDRYETTMAIFSTFNPRLDGKVVGSWTAQRLKMQMFSKLEFSAFTTSKWLFNVLFIQFLTLGDELMGTRSNLNPVKYTAIRKADREGQSADIFVDALFRFAIEVRLHRRCET